MLEELNADKTFQSVGYDYRRGSGYVGIPWGAGAQVSYLVDSDTIRLTLSDGRKFDFETPDDEPGFPFAATRTFTNRGEIDDVRQLFLFDPTLVDGVPLTYVRRGWFIDATMGEDGQVTNASFFFGYKTPEMPRTGSAIYKTGFFGSGTAAGIRYSLWANSTSDFSANFANGTVSSNLHLIGEPLEGGSLADFGTYSGSGRIGASEFSGTFTGADGGFWGGFFGPSAAEFGYSYVLQNATIDAYGYVTGRKD